MAQNMGMSQGQEQTLNPKMIAFYELLQQPNVDLDQAINSELEENPALDITAERLCPACGAVMPAAVCRECGYKLTREDEEEVQAEQEPDQIVDLAIEAAPMEKPVYTGEDDGFDVMARLSATETLTAHLRWLWRLSCTEENRELGDHIIGCINDDGYLDTDLETLSEGLGVEMAHSARRRSFGRNSKRSNRRAWARALCANVCACSWFTATKAPHLPMSRNSRSS